MTLLLLTALAGNLAWAGEIHAGIPVRGVPGLGEPSFQTASLGWTAGLADGGFVRVFVGKTEEEAAEWYARAVHSLTIVPPAYAAFGDEAVGDGQALLVFRDGNVAVFVRADQDAAAVAERMKAAIVDGVPWPTAPVLAARADGTWEISAGDLVGIRAEGGTLHMGEGWRFGTKPRAVTGWDLYGRPALDLAIPAE